MKWAWKIPQAEPNIERELIHSGWIGVNMNIMWFVLASLAPLFLIATGLLWYVFSVDPAWWQVILRFENSYGGALSFVGLCLLLIILGGVVHELLHVVMMPKFLSEKVIVGMSFGGAFSLTSQNMSKSRYLAVGLAPFIIGCVTLFMVGAFQALNVYNTLFLISIILGACVDIVMAIFIALRLPGRSILVFIKGEDDNPKLYYKKVLSDQIQGNFRVGK